MEQATTEIPRFYHHDPDNVFWNAIKVGQLTENSRDANYAGKYMYMHTSIVRKATSTDDGEFVDHFKNIDTRQYDVKVTRGRRIG